VAAGWNHNLALRADGTVVAWGVNNSGQTNTPPNLTNVLAVTGGSAHSLALTGNGPPALTEPIRDPKWRDNHLTISLRTQSGRVYALEYQVSLADGRWTALPLVPGNGGTQILADPTAASAQRFYRVRQW